MSLVNTRLQNLRDNSPLDKWETRASRWGALDMFQNQTNAAGSIVDESLKIKAANSAGMNLEVPVIDYDAGVQVTNVTIPLVTTGSPSTSQMMAITFTNYYFGFLIHPAAHKNNEISMQREFNAQMQKHIFKMAQLMEDAAIAKLEADKTQVLADDLGGRYALTADVVVGPLAEQDAIIGDINPLQAGNDYFDLNHVLANGSLESHVRNNLLEKGQYNSEDKTYQYNDKIWHFTNSLANAVGQKATGIAVQANSLGMLQQFAPDCLMKNKSHKHLWGIETLPFLDIPIGTYYYDDAVDGSGLHGAASAHLTATLSEAYAFHHAVAWLTPYNSAPATRASSIMKFAIANA